MTDQALLQLPLEPVVAPIPHEGPLLVGNHELTVAEYFAGIGLVRLGLEQAGWQVVFANDFAQQKFEMYRAHFDDADDHYHVGDIFELDPAAIPQTTLATSSFPCIDLSLAGNRNGIHGAHSSAFWGFTRILEAQGEQRPPLVLLENVAGWLTSNDGKDFRLTIQALNNLGYSCDVFALDAIRFTPQSRPRIFVLGIRGVERHENVAALKARPSSLATKALKEAVLRHQDLNWHFLNVPQPPPPGQVLLNEIVEVLPDDDPRWWNIASVEKHLASMAPAHPARVQGLQEEAGITYRTMYRRKRQGGSRAEVRSDEFAGCLRTARGGSSRQMIVCAGNGLIRMRHMTPREYARLQGVPEDYPIPGNDIQALTGFGDAVCVPVLTWIAENIINPLVG